MSTPLPVQRRSSTSEATIIPFPRRYIPETESVPAVFVAERLPALSDLQDQLKELIESYVAEAYLNTFLEGRIAEDNPFDAVYISELTPDVLDYRDLQLLQRFATIKDLSDTLVFSDDWED